MFPFFKPKPTNTKSSVVSNNRTTVVPNTTSVPNSSTIQSNNQRKSPKNELLNSWKNQVKVLTNKTEYTGNDKFEKIKNQRSPWYGMIFKDSDKSQAKVVMIKYVSERIDGKIHIVDRNLLRSIPKDEFNNNIHIYENGKFVIEEIDLSKITSYKVVYDNSFSYIHESNVILEHNNVTLNLEMVPEYRDANIIVELKNPDEKVTNISNISSSLKRSIYTFSVSLSNFGIVGNTLYRYLKKPDYFTDYKLVKAIKNGIDKKPSVKSTYSLRSVPNKDPNYFGGYKKTITKKKSTKKSTKKIIKKSTKKSIKKSTKKSTKK